MRQVGVWMGLGMVVCVLGLATTAAADPPADVLAYGVFAIQGTSIGSRARVQGDVGCLFGELSLGQSTRVTGQAAAPTIRLRRHARATGGYFCSSLDGGSATCDTFPNPLVATPEIVLVGPPSNIDVSVERRGKATEPLAPGAYGALSAGSGAEVTLAGGIYQFASIELRSRARVVCLAACDLIVRGRVKLGQAARLGAADSIGAGEVIVRIAGTGERIALDAKSRVRIRGTIYAPSGEVKLGAAAKQTGALVGNTVSVGPRARVQSPSGGT
jgi:hypothetical protein